MLWNIVFKNQWYHMFYIIVRCRVHLCILIHAFITYILLLNYSLVAFKWIWIKCSDDGGGFPCVYRLTHFICTQFQPWSITNKYNCTHQPGAFLHTLNEIYMISDLVLLDRRRRMRCMCFTIFTCHLNGRIAIYHALQFLFGALLLYN